MRFAWITESLAQSPRPRVEDLDYVAELFDAVVVLLSHSEVGGEYISELERRGLRVLHKPTLDFHPVELFDLVEAVLFIESVVSSGGRVLVHCAGGVGRSSVVTAGYLHYTGVDLYDAVVHVRSRVPGALEVPWQHLVLEDFKDLLGVLGRDKLRVYVEALRGSGLGERGARHLFKVFQLVAELKRSLLVSERREHLSSALLHAHYEELRSKLVGVLGLRVASSESPLVALAHALDYDESSRVVVIVVDDTDPACAEVTLLCDEPCRDVVSEAEKYRDLAERAVGRRLIFDYADYANYV
jgi:protein-tyrosine phosphatase